MNDDEEARKFIRAHRMTTPLAYDDLTRLLSRARDEAAQRESFARGNVAIDRAADSRRTEPAKCARCGREPDPRFRHECPADYVGVVDLTPDWENMSDAEWAAILAKRIAGATGETWFENGIAQAVEVAMRRARTKEREAICAWLRAIDDRNCPPWCDGWDWFSDSVAYAIEKKFGK